MEPVWVVEAIDIMFDICNIIDHVYGADATGDTQIAWGNTTKGELQYYYVDVNGTKSLERGKFTFSTNIFDGFALVTGPHVQYTAVRNEAVSGNAPSISTGYAYYQYGLISWHGGTFYTTQLYIDGQPVDMYGNNLSIDVYKSTVPESQIPTFYYSGAYSMDAHHAGILFGFDWSTDQGVANTYGVSYIPIGNQTLSYNEIVPYVVDWANEQNAKETDEQGETIYEPITPDVLPSWDDIMNPTEPTESTEPSGGGNCGDCGDTYIYVNADGSLSLNNDISGNFELSIDNNADLSLSINAAAGAFGAGAIVIDPEADINITAAAGAFGAGAFGAGAIVAPDVDISGDLNIGAGAFGAGAFGAGAFGAGAFGAGAIVAPDVDISGEISVGDISGSIDVSEVNISGEVDVSEVSISGELSVGDVSISGGDINIDQSGSTVTNNYYYQAESSDPVQESFTLDYDEILSEGELESILTDETYILMEVDTDISQLSLQPAPVTQLPERVVEVSQMSVTAGLDMLSQMGILAPFTSIAVFSFFVNTFRR